MVHLLKNATIKTSPLNRKEIGMFSRRQIFKGALLALVSSLLWKSQRLEAKESQGNILVIGAGMA
jgi:hypothetical protein